MLSAFLLSLREGLEAALVVGIVLGALRQMRRGDLLLPVWLGALTAALLSLGAALVLNRLDLALEDPAEAIFEGLTMLLAAGLLTWMIFWMRRQAGGLKGRLEAGVERASRGGLWSLFGLAFLAVLREGLELALFLTAAALTAGGSRTLVGALLGLVTAGALGWGLFASTLRLDLRRFFGITGLLLFLFAAGLVGHAVQEFNELGWIPSVIGPVWDLNPLLSETSLLGGLLKALFGYNGDPSLTEVLAYLAYCAVIPVGLWLLGRRARLTPPGKPA